jgi:hypothetical protein
MKENKFGSTSNRKHQRSLCLWNFICFQMTDIFILLLWVHHPATLPGPGWLSKWEIKLTLFADKDKRYKFVEL